ncbi:hypothetical protein ERICV_05119 [Paenibacillus phage phiERICV]|uniref:Uncharacterized protein n=1 Tax=Paenibacillus larvae subsp. larvae TaxID=147375 RepID=A0A6C0QNZ4_9BACL|nr:hypothetical protein [Paenibacillus larvae]QHZ50018.1 hypothetical protein ERICV_00841 [Paenibacillus larvae subsp. larvae]QHZ54103.1 hypothetical protein ERICV_05119 [Paenibacillus phage phiERICV]
MAKPNAKSELLQEKEVSTSELAAIIGKSPQWVRQLTREKVLEQVNRGKYVLSEAVQAYIKHVEGESSNGKISYRDEKAEHERIKKEMAELELEEMRSHLHTTQDVQEAWSDLIVEFRKRMTTLPPRMAGQLAFIDNEKKVKKLLTDEITAALQVLAQYDPVKEAGKDEQTEIPNP